MNPFNKSRAGTFLSAVFYLMGAAQAMEIRQFDKMAVSDQGDYIQALVDGAQKVLNDEGRSDLAVKVDQLFSEIPHGDTMPLGMEEFENNLAQARIFDAERHAKNHDAVRLEVEHAMIMTLKKNGIILPPSFMHVGDNFKPKLPPNKEEKN